MIYILTHTGIKFDLENPTVDMICLEDIAHALSNICRFTGHTYRFFSVAQHSWNCSMLMRDLELGNEYRIAALMHDAQEAYIGDVSSPLKQLLPDYNRIETKIARLVSERFGLTHERRVWEKVYEIDKAALAAEIGQIDRNALSAIQPLNPSEAKGRFKGLARYLGIE